MVRSELARPTGNPPIHPPGYLLGWTVVAFFRLAPALLEPIALRAIGGADLNVILASATVAALATVAILGLAIAALALGAPRARRPEARGLFNRGALVILGLAGALQVPRVLAILLHGGDHLPRESVLILFQRFLDHSHFAVRWFFFAAVVGGSFLRNQVVSLDARLRRALIVLVTGGAFLLFLVVVVTAALTAVERRGLPIAALLLATVVILLATQSVAWARRIADRLFPPERERDDAYRRLRRFEVYRQAAEAVADGRAPPTDLPRLRERLGLSEEEARLAVATARAPASPSPLATGSVLSGRYRLERLVGAGAHGRVFLASDVRDGVRVAVKEIALGPDGRRPFGTLEAEIRAAARIRHPALLTATDYFAEGSAAYVVTPYLPGGSLADRIRSGGRMHPRDAATLVRHILEGLAAAHAAGVLHRDVKPANVLLDENGAPRLADFGVALVPEAGLTLVNSYSVPGTLAYLPPEALAGGETDARGDVYAAGTVLFELLAGRLPRPSEDAPPDAPAALREVLRRARAPDPGERYANAAEMGKALEMAMSEASER